MHLGRGSNYVFSNFDAKYEGLRKYDILALDKSFVVTLWMISIPVVVLLTRYVLELVVR